MYNMITRYLSKLTKDEVNTFARNKNITLTDDELNFTYNFIKKNYESILKNPKLFNIERYSNNYSKENFSKITKVWHEYIQKYANYL